MGFAGIMIDPGQIGGVPSIRGFRIPVATVVGLLAQGMSATDVLADYPDLRPDDIREALRYSAAAVNERQLPPVASA
ncbi:MAG: DUF433 domain-containing protein [Gammaproteobacteria bacterium]|nr:DUF433 domain-containing protein [Gammaproteobacteria bacterium]MYJ75352.1 DUF433 domain-containing protein [Gammaproteobacteria bacterium]